MAAGLVTAAQDEPGTYFVTEPRGATNCWQVGTRYRLLRVLGQGSFSCVCLAEDAETGEQVALKRVGDVFHSAENARRCLREVCIMRRLQHPNIVQLKDAFVKPCQTGRMFYRRGEWVSMSLDLYMAMEYCPHGDLFSLHGQLSDADVQYIMWQLLSAVRYLHANRVWHRDVKSANVLLASERGRRVVKLADFGSARSASLPHMAPEPRRPHNGSGARVDRSGSESDLVACASEAGGFKAPLTRTVCTPCYRAPEVIMSRGEYSSALDMWSVGCVFGELLQRQAALGDAPVPALKVAPVFALTEDALMRTPGAGEHYMDEPALPGSKGTRRELDILFDVIGTPPWKSIKAVPMAEWRQYLGRIPARAPSLMRRFGASGEVALDLLARLLAFDPGMRACADEAISHEYFSKMGSIELPWFWEEEADHEDIAARLAHASSGGADAGIKRAAEERRSLAQTDIAEETPTWELARTCSRSSDAAEAVLGLAAAVAESPDPGTPTAALATLAAISLADARTSPARARGADGARAFASARHVGDPGAGLDHEVAPAPQPDNVSPPPDKRQRLSPPPQPSFHEISDPSEALAALETEMAETEALACAADAGGMRLSCNSALREMLELECKRVAESVLNHRTQQREVPVTSQVPDVLRSHCPGCSRAGGRAASPHSGTFGVGTQAQESASFPPSGLDSSMLMAQRLAAVGRLRLRPHACHRCHLRPDSGVAQDPSIIGLERIPHHADAEMASADAEAHLRPNRHGEWGGAFTLSGDMAAHAGPMWGVSLTHCGAREAEVAADPLLLEAVRRQHAR
uniref:Protein kinase domain-containing protein n=1 Tax=Chlamydomonas euryale TaxID=1486919 RepID=A0A7R9Z669_9CHLO|mmetsp:Transcript_5595/g.16979  ORF Transcript_5595/g.16979 Transcript_5595/m.16979 type:complete len:807 (+) Transcript_5595:143-2563(+)